MFRRAVSGCLVLLVAGCVTGLSQGPGASVTIAEDLTLGIPSGYCMDEKSSKATKSGNTYLLGRCNEKSKSIPALIRMSIGPNGSAAAIGDDPTALVAFFTSRAGLASLSPSGRPGDLRLISIVRLENDFLLRLAAKGEGEYWRAIAGVKSRLVTISAIGTAEQPLSPDDSRTVVEQALAAHRSANPSPKTPLPAK